MGSPVGAIIGTLVAIFAVVAACLVLVHLCRAKRGQEEEEAEAPLARQGTNRWMRKTNKNHKTTNLA